MIQVDRYIKYLEKHNMNQAQFILLYLLYLKRYDLIERYKAMFPSEDGSAIGNINLNDLIKRDYIEKVNDDVHAAGYRLLPKFTNLWIDKFTAAEEFWNLYPAFVINNGTRFSLTLMPEDEFRDLYWRKIEGMRDEHQEVIKDLQYAVENNLIKGTIKNFVSSRQWLAIRTERLDNNGKTPTTARSQEY